MAATQILITILPANGTDTAAIFTANRVHRQPQEDLLPYNFGQLDAWPLKNQFPIRRL